MERSCRFQILSVRAHTMQCVGSAHESRTLFDRSRLRSTVAAQASPSARAVKAVSPLQLRQSEVSAPRPRLPIAAASTQAPSSPSCEPDPGVCFQLDTPFPTWIATGVTHGKQTALKGGINGQRPLTIQLDGLQPGAGWAAEHPEARCADATTLLPRAFPVSTL